MISDERGSAEKREQNKMRSQNHKRSTIWGFVKKNVRGSQYKPRGDWFSFAKVGKLCFLCSCNVKQYETSISRRCIRNVYFLRHPPGTASTYDSQRKWDKKIIIFYIWIFFLQKCIDLPKDACIHPLEPCFIMDGCTFCLLFLFLLLFIWLLLNC